MNKILSKILKSRKGHYVHALEVNSVYEIGNKSITFKNYNHGIRKNSK